MTECVIFASPANVPALFKALLSALVRNCPSHICPDTFSRPGWDRCEAGYRRGLHHPHQSPCLVTVSRCLSSANCNHLSGFQEQGKSRIFIYIERPTRHMTMPGTLEPRGHDRCTAASAEQERRSRDMCGLLSCERWGGGWGGCYLNCRDFGLAEFRKHHSLSLFFHSLPILIVWGRCSAVV